MILIFIIFLISLSLTGLYRLYAIRKSIVDVPNHRSSHTVSTPSGGGIALVIAWYTGLIYCVITKRIENQLFFALLSGLPLTLVGLADDIFNLSPRIRIAVQVLCASLGLFVIGGLDVISIGKWDLQYHYLWTILAFIAIIWSINLFNFLDGIDGYISTEIIFIGISVYILTGDHVGLLLAAATLGFLIWNWQKAKIFMGDTGSTILGYTVAILAIYHQNNHISSIPVWLILTSVFWMDATVTLFRRIRNREKLSVAHRDHAYQRIVRSGFSHQKTVLWSLAVNCIGFVLAWFATQYNTLSWLFLIPDLILLILVLKYIDKKKAFE